MVAVIRFKFLKYTSLRLRKQSEAKNIRSLNISKEVEHKIMNHVLTKTILSPTHNNHSCCLSFKLLTFHQKPLLSLSYHQLSAHSGINWRSSCFTDLSFVRTFHF